MGNKRTWASAQRTRVDLTVGETTQYEVHQARDREPWLTADTGVSFWADTADAVEGFRDAVNDWADQYTAWDKEPER